MLDEYQKQMTPFGCNCAARQRYLGAHTHVHYDDVIFMTVAVTFKNSNEIIVIPDSTISWRRTCVHVVGGVLTVHCSEADGREHRSCVLALPLSEG